GTHAFSAALKTAGAQTFALADTASGSLAASQAIAVSPAATSRLIVAGLPASQSAGNAQAFTVTAQDAYGNVTPAYPGTVHFTSRDALAALPGDYAFAAADAGAHAFSARFQTAGSQSLGATDTVNGSAAGAGSLTVNPAVAAPPDAGDTLAAARDAVVGFQ